MNKFLSIALLIFIFGGCGSKPRQYDLKQRFSQSDRNKLVYVANGYLGVKYKYGGINNTGFDCSGLIYRIYLDALRLKLPRTVKGQYQASYGIPLSRAQVGDLAFFKIKNQRLDHAGIIIDRGRFIHATRSKGVVISDLNDDYYRKRFTGIRRLR